MQVLDHQFINTFTNEIKKIVKKNYRDCESEAVSYNKNLKRNSSKQRLFS